MSYLARLSARATGTRVGASAVLPKGPGGRPAPNIARAQDATEKDESLAPIRQFSARSPIRREEDESEEVSRQEIAEDPEVQRQANTEGEEEVAPLRRQEGGEEEEIAPLRRQEGEEEEIAPLRRQEGEEEEVSPLRRQEVEEDPEARPRRIIARQEEIPLEEGGQAVAPLAQGESGSDAESPSQELAGEQEPTDLQALRRDLPQPAAPSMPTQADQGAGRENQTAERPFAQAVEFLHPQAPTPGEESAIPQIVPANTGGAETRPTVVIDQLDVLIQEPAAPADRNPPRPGRERALRARYLRRL